jgi:hypothetical protein
MTRVVLFSSLIITQMLFDAFANRLLEADITDIGPPSSQCIAEIFGQGEKIDQIYDEYQSWNYQRGVYLFAPEGAPRELQDFVNTPYAEPYQEMPIHRLLAYVEEQDHFAMIAALQRNDVDSEQKNNIAKSLVRLGDTGLALRHEMFEELVAAESEYEINETVTPQIKQHIKNALVFASFGVEQKSLETVYQYISLSADPDYPSPLLHNNLLQDNDYDDIRELTFEMTQTVNENRKGDNYPALDPSDLPPIAQFSADIILYGAYVSYPDQVETLKLQTVDGELSLAKNTCIQDMFDLMDE